MSAQPYKRPPITEAVIEMRVEGAIAQGILEKIQKRLAEHYPIKEELNQVQVQFEIGKPASSLKQEWFGFKLSNDERNEIITLQPRILAISRLAPYLGWEQFRSQAYYVWDTWRKAAGATRIVRLGVRYINRLDIPVEGDGAIRLEDYLNLHIRIPSFQHAPMSNFVIQATVPLATDECFATVNSSTVQSPLVKHVSFILDFDIFREKDIPQHPNELWAQIDRIRALKNQIFEASITDRTRGLFQ